MSISEKKPKVGVGVLVVSEGRILFGKRINSHGSGTWCPPGGHLEFGEDPAACAARELKEETGLEAVKIRPGPWTNDFFTEEQKHYITIFMHVAEFTGLPEVMEPEKCLEWRWFDLNALPDNLFLSVKNLLSINKLLNG